MKAGMADAKMMQAGQTTPHLVQGLGVPLGEALLVVWQFLYSWPRLGCGRSQQAENLEDLVNLLPGHQAVSQNGALML